MARDSRTLISLADLIVAVHKLEADAAAAAEIASLLDLLRTPPSPVSRPSRVVRRSDVAGRDTAQERSRGVPEAYVVEDATATPVARAVVSSVLTAVTETNDDADVGRDPLPAQSPGASPMRPRLEPLFTPGWSRAILSAALATASDDGPIDIEKIVPRIATKRSIDRLPRLPRPTMRRGVQLLLDRGPSLAPYSRDQDWLADQVRNVGGKDQLQVVEFFTCPSRDGPIDDDGNPTIYATPAAGTVVLAMTDLGIGRPPGWTDWATATEWLAFAMRLRKAGCPFVALVPYPPDRWPPTLKGRLLILSFDRATAASTVRRLVRGGHMVAR